MALFYHGEKTPTYKIDRDPRGLWKFFIFKRKKGWFGYGWSLVHKTDDLGVAEQWIEEDKKLPRYYV